MDIACDPSCDNPQAEELVREMLSRLADKWTLQTIEALADGEMRFTRLRQRLDGISQKMLTQTLRQFERDGLVSRHVHAVVPPRVDYRLTPLGRSLGEAVCSVWLWAEAHQPAVEQARATFDRQQRLAPRETA